MCISVLLLMFELVMIDMFVVGLILGFYLIKVVDRMLMVEDWF